MDKTFTIYVIHSAHTDIGYTHPPEQIKLMYLDHYDHVLDICQRTKDAPEEERFKWTCETSWQVQHYLRHRPEREEEFLACVRRGQIEITASYLHFFDMIDADAYRRSLQWVVQYCREKQLPLHTALHCDINGWPWAVADILADYDIPYFCSQVHLDSATDPLGRRGSGHYFWLLEQERLKRDMPIRIPQAFWWQGPNGKKVLHWLGEHYLQGNVLGLSGTTGFAANKSRYFTETDRMSADELYVTAERELPRYLDRLHMDGYSLNCLLLSTGGFYVDNSPPDERWCQVIARWNREHTTLRIRTATLSEWFAALSQELDKENLPTYNLAWPDHWAHGLGAATPRIAQARRTQRRRADAIAVVQQANSAYASSSLEQALEHERLALEHTYDAWSTTAHPSSPMNDFAQSSKELAFHRAELYLEEAIGHALRATHSAAENRGFLYVGPSTRYDGQYTVHFKSDDIQIDPATQMLISEDGKSYPFQRDDSDLPHFVATLPLVHDKMMRFSLSTRTQREAKSNYEQETVLESPAWQLEVDPTTGTLRHLQEKLTGREWVETSHEYGFGQLVQEVVVHPLGREAVGNLARFIALDVATDEARDSFATLPIFAHTTPRMSGKAHKEKGNVFDAITLVGQAERIGQVQITWRNYHTVPLVELVLDWNKAWNDLPEAAYVAFPFATTSGQLLLETGGGFFQPGSHVQGGQLPGTCVSYYTIQRAARITDTDGRTLLWSPVDAPLVMPNKIHYNNWEATVPWQWNGFLASMPVNHYWHTNFPTSQRGFIRLRYRFLSPHGYSDDEQALEISQPIEALGWC